MPLTILVADDDFATRLSIGDYLENAGYLVLLASNGSEALRMIEVYQPHLVVTDIAMPQMDGYDLIKQIRQRPEFRLLPVVFLTARSKTEERVKGYQSGCDVYLSKPFELYELGAVVRNLLDRMQVLESERRSQISKSEGDLPTSSSGVSALTEVEFDLTQREKQVLQLLAEGSSNNQIGEHLHLSPRTVEKYVSSLFRKTNTGNRSELLRFAIERHLVP